MNRLQEARKAAGLSQSQLAEKAGVNIRSIQLFEQGIRDINSGYAITIYRLAKALECDVEEILNL